MANPGRYDLRWCPAGIAGAGVRTASVNPNSPRSTAIPGLPRYRTARAGVMSVLMMSLRIREERHEEPAK
jgi:hypothetical protein